MPKSRAEYMRRYRAKEAGDGTVTVTLRVPDYAKADFLQAAERCRENPGLTIGSLQDEGRGCFVKLHPKREKSK